MRPIAQAHLDTVLEIPAPEYIVFRHVIAGPVSRLFAVLIDHGIIAFLMLCAILVFAVIISAESLFGSSAPGAGEFLLYIVFFVLYWFYFFLFEWLAAGRTPGKRALGLRVVSEDGAALDVFQVAIRNLLRIADMFPMQTLVWLFFLPSYGAGAVSCFFSRGRTGGVSFQRLGDLAAGTIVIREAKRKAAGAEKESERIAHLASALNMLTVPSPDFVLALGDFVRRRKRLNPGRVEEICSKIEGPLRRYFRAEGLECTGEELALAVFYHLYRSERRGA